MTTFYRLLTILALAVPAWAADMKFSSLPTATSPSTNSYLPIIDLNLLPAAQNQKYLLTNLATVAQVNLATNGFITGAQVPSYQTNATLASLGGVTNSAAGITNALGYVPVNKAGDTMTAPLIPPTYTVSTLPASSSGATVWCSDIVTPNGTGAFVYYDGANWRDCATRIVATASVPVFLSNAYAVGWSGISPTMVAVSADDFWPGAISSGVLGFLYNTPYGGGGSTETAIAGQTYFRINTGSAVGGGNEIVNQQYVPQAGDYLLYGTSGSVFSDNNSTDHFYVVSGFNKRDGTGALGTSCSAFVFDKWKVSPAGASISATNNWQCITGEGSTYTVADSGVAPDFGNYQQLKVVMTSLTNCVFYINGTSVATNVANLPTTYVSPCTTIKKTTGTANTFYWTADWIYASKRWGTARNFR